MAQEVGASGLFAVLAAIITVGGAVIVGYIAHFMSDDYRRFRDGAALAAGLAGELGSYAVPLQALREQALPFYIQAVDAGNRAALTLRGIDRPTDFFFDKNVEKLGLLGAASVEKVVLVYGNIRAFRLVFGMIHEHHATMSDIEFKNRCLSAIAALDRAAEHGVPLVNELRRRAAMPFRPTWPWNWSRPAV